MPKEKAFFTGALNRGLEGVAVSSTELSTIENSELFVRGFPLEELSQNSSYEEAAFLLIQGRLPLKKEWEEWKAALQEEFFLSAEEGQMLSRLPHQNAHPMAWLRAALSAMALSWPEPAPHDTKALYQTALKLLAKTPLIIAFLNSLRTGWPLPAGPEGRIEGGPLNQGAAFHFLRLLRGEPPSPVEAKAFDVSLILHAEHDFNCSSFCARVTASSLSDVFSSVVSAIGALKGPLHGGANERAFHMLSQISTEREAIAFIDKALQDKKKIMGFGHRIYREKDPRAQILKGFSKTLTKAVGKPKLYEISLAMEEKMRQAKGLPANVDFYSASVYHCLRIPVDLFTPIFAMSRMAGWLAHIFEQYKNNRIYRPRGQWIGEKGKKWRPLAEREPMLS